MELNFKCILIFPKWRNKHQKTDPPLLLNRYNDTKSILLFVDELCILNPNADFFAQLKNSSTTAAPLLQSFKNEWSISSCQKCIQKKPENFWLDAIHNSRKYPKTITGKCNNRRVA